MTSGLLSGLRNMGCTFSKMLTVFLLFVYNFLIVRNVSRVGHRSLYPKIAWYAFAFQAIARIS